MDITNITVITSATGCDTILLYTEGLTAAQWPYDESPFFSLNAARGKGVEWAKHNFPLLKIAVYDASIGR